MNVLAHTVWTEYTHSVVQTLGQQNVNRQHYALHYDMMLASVHRPVHTFENDTNLRTYLAN